MNHADKIDWPSLETFFAEWKREEEGGARVVQIAPPPAIEPTAEDHVLLKSLSVEWVTP